MSETVDDIIIVGGGTAGWLTAAYLSQELGTFRKDGVKITLIESSDIPTIGVGEGTFPSLRRTLDVIGIKEKDFIKESEATFKQAIQFTNWRVSNGAEPHTYYHLFDGPRKLNGNIDITPYWLLDDNPKKLEFAKAVSPQQAVCENVLGPKVFQDPEFSGRLNYAYHLDAGKFAEQLKTRAKFARVNHVVGTIVNISQKENGDIDSVELENGDTHSASFFVDCTGFAGLLIGKTLSSDFKSVKDTLFVDRAIAVQVAYEDPKCDIASATVSTAHPHGWTWDIGLHSRRGIGYCWSSDHTSADIAEKTLRTYIGDSSGEKSVRHIKMRTGYREESWRKNCVAIGLSGGFLEPLEATGISLTEASIRLLADYFPRSGNIKLARKKFNRIMTRYYEQAVNFIKMHYCISDRCDSDFWIDNRDQKTVPDELKELLELWKYNYPRDTDFEEWQKTFGEESYLYVLLGMGTNPDLSNHRSGFSFQGYAEQHFKTIKTLSEQGIKTLPTHRHLIDQYLSV